MNISRWDRLSFSFPSSIRQVLSILKYTQVHTMSQVQVQVL